MAGATNVRAGGLVTSTAAEIQLNLVDIQNDNTAVVEVFIELVSGSVQFGVYENTTVFAPQIDSSQRTFSTAGDKAIFTVYPTIYNLRCKGVGTFSITY